MAAAQNISYYDNHYAVHIMFLILSAIEFEEEAQEIMNEKMCVVRDNVSQYFSTNDPYSLFYFPRLIHQRHH
jgi:hypothetical protein